MMGIVNNAGRLGLGRERKNGWTVARRRTFLDVLAATARVCEAEKAAGMAEGSARKLRHRDARFGRLWADALAAAYLRLEDELLAHAMGGALAPDDPGSERDEPAPEHRRAFDPQLAIAVLKLRGKRAPGRRRGEPPLDPAALDVALMNKLGDLAARLERPRCG